MRPEEDNARVSLEQYFSGRLDLASFKPNIDIYQAACYIKCSMLHTTTKVRCNCTALFTLLLLSPIVKIRGCRFLITNNYNGMYA